MQRPAAMTAREPRWNAASLELVPLDAPLPATQARSARPSTAVQDGERVREAYLRSRFPGVIRGLADLSDAGRVMDAARCYVEDGRADRARELVRMAIDVHPDVAAFRQSPWEEPPTAASPGSSPARLYAGEIHHHFTSAAGRASFRH
jgi:hypothetical protein